MQNASVFVISMPQLNPPQKAIPAMKKAPMTPAATLLGVRNSRQYRPMMDESLIIQNASASLFLSGRTSLG